MKFLQTYKRLDHLCRDMNGVGVTGYLEDMEQLPDGASIVPGWKEDYNQLKHYRYLRNRIVHEVNAEEEDLCSSADVAWIEDFYGRILGSSDPLVLYRRTKTASSNPDLQLLSRTAATPHPADDPSAVSSQRAPRHSIYSSHTENNRPVPARPISPPSTPSAPHTGCALWLLFAFCIAAFLLSEFVFR